MGTVPSGFCGDCALPVAHTISMLFYLVHPDIRNVCIVEDTEVHTTVLSSGDYDVPWHAAERISAVLHGGGMLSASAACSDFNVHL